MVVPKLAGRPSGVYFSRDRTVTPYVPGPVSVHTVRSAGGCILWIYGASSKQHNANCYYVVAGRERRKPATHALPNFLKLYVPGPVSCGGTVCGFMAHARDGNYRCNV